MLVLLPDDVSDLEKVWPWQAELSLQWDLSTVRALLSIYTPTGLCWADRSTTAAWVLPCAQAETSLLGEPWSQSDKTKVKESSAAVALQKRTLLCAVFFIRTRNRHASRTFFFSFRVFSVFQESTQWFGKQKSLSKEK